MYCSNLTFDENVIRSATFDFTLEVKNVEERAEQLQLVLHMKSNTIFCNELEARETHFFTLKVQNIVKTT